MPSQKVGTAIARALYPAATRPSHERGRTADRMPRGVAITTATSSEATVSWTVTGMRWAISVRTGRPLR